MDRLDASNSNMSTRNNSGTRKYCSSIRSLIFVLATPAETIALALLAFIDPGTDRPIDGMLYQNYAMQNCSIRYLGFTQVIDPVTIFEVTLNSTCGRSNSSRYWLVIHPQINLWSLTPLVRYPCHSAWIAFSITELLWK